MKFLKKSQLLTLKAKIKGLAEEGHRVHKLIQKSSGSEKNDYWDVKRNIGREARYHLIAYGLLRGKDFKEIEPNAAPAGLNSYNFDYSYLAQIIQHHYYYYFDKQSWTPAALQRLLTTGSMDVKEVA